MGDADVPHALEALARVLDELGIAYAIAGNPVRALGPPDFSISSLAVSGPRIVAGGNGPGNTPQVRVGTLRADSIEWGHAIELRQPSDPELEYSPEVALDTSTRQRIAVARRGESWNESLLVFEELHGTWVRREALPPWRTSGADGFEFEYGSPLVMHGDELFTLSSPGSEFEGQKKLGESSSTLLRFQRTEQGWHGTPLPLNRSVVMLWWGVALTPDGSTLALLTRHRGGGYFVDLYLRAGSGFQIGPSISVSGTPSGVACTRSRVVVTSGQVVVLARDQHGWSLERSIRLPDTEWTVVGRGTHWSPFADGHQLVVRRADPALYLVDVERSGAVRQIVLPSGIDVKSLGAMAFNESRLFAVLGPEILWWSIA